MNSNSVNLECLALKNFKRFKKLEMNFRKLTIITGPNSSGKSAILSAIGCLLQSGATNFYSRPYPFALKLNDQIISHGTYKETVNDGGIRKKISIDARLRRSDGVIDVSSSFGYRAKEDSIYPDKIKITSDTGTLELKRDSGKGYLICSTINKEEREFGKEVDAFSRKFLELINENLLNEPQSKKSKKELEREVDRRMKRQMEGTGQRWEKIGEKSIPELIELFKGDTAFRSIYRDFTLVFDEFIYKTKYIGPLRAYPQRVYEETSMVAKIRPVMWRTRKLRIGVLTTKVNTNKLNRF